jgi:glutaredoxin
MSVILYSTGCPKCKVLKAKLDSKKIKYDVVDDVDEMLRLGMTTVPCLGVDGKVLNFKESVDYINSL